MPSIMVYLTAEAYVKLVNRASHMTKITPSTLARIYIEKGLEKEILGE